jgi:hypothetical protein
MMPRKSPSTWIARGIVFDQCIERAKGVHSVKIISAETLSDQGVAEKKRLKKACYRYK